jgi:phosphomannomutase
VNRARCRIGIESNREPNPFSSRRRDTRESGTWIEAELAHGACGEGATVRSAGVVPTPAVAYLTRSGIYDAGVVISASHNPYEDNGIKVFSGKGEKFTETVEREVESIVADTSWTPKGSDAEAGGDRGSRQRVRRSSARRVFQTQAPR